MSDWIDVSAPLDASLPCWPGSQPVHFEENLSIRSGDPVDVRTMTLGLHTGTHIDAPSHFLEGGATVDQVPLAKMIGPCVVADLRGHRSISAALLAAQNLPATATRLLCLTDNSDGWAPEFDADFVGLSLDGAEWLAANGYDLVGNDYLSVQPHGGDDEIHRVLLRQEIVLLEGLMLKHVEPGPYELLCLPMKLVGVEGAPARVLLKREADGD